MKLFKLLSALLLVGLLVWIPFACEKEEGTNSDMNTFTIKDLAESYDETFLPIVKADTPKDSIPASKTITQKRYDAIMKAYKSLSYEEIEDFIEQRKAYLISNKIVDEDEANTWGLKFGKMNNIVLII